MLEVRTEEIFRCIACLSGSSKSFVLCAVGEPGAGKNRTRKPGVCGTRLSSASVMATCVPSRCRPVVTASEYDTLCAFLVPQWAGSEADPWVGFCVFCFAGVPELNP